MLCSAVSLWEAASLVKDQGFAFLANTDGLMIDCRTDTQKEKIRSREMNGLQVPLHTASSPARRTLSRAVWTSPNLQRLAVRCSNAMGIIAQSAPLSFRSSGQKQNKKKQKKSKKFQSKVQAQVKFFLDVYYNIAVIHLLGSGPL